MTDTKVKPEHTVAHKHEVITYTFVTCNLDKDQDDDGHPIKNEGAYDYTHFKATYRHHIRSLGHQVTVCYQEWGHGPQSCRVHGKHVKNAHFHTIGTEGVHNGIDIGHQDIGDQSVIVISAHALHVKTSGKEAHDNYLATLADLLNGMTHNGQAWIIGADWNESIEKVLPLLHGDVTSHGDGIVGFIVHGVKVSNEHADTWGKDRHLTDHPAYVIEVKAA